jgi:hypothetical protein
MLVSTILKAVELASKIDFRRLRDDAGYRLSLVKTLADSAPAKR